MSDSELMERQRIHLAEQERFEVFGETLTRRDQFAMAAMSGWNANPETIPNNNDYEYIASISVSQADALIAELDKEVVK